VPYLKPQLGVLMEDVLNREVDDPLWVQVVVDYLSLTDFDPAGVLLVACSRFERAHRV
jgi:hypothetical protein